MSAPGFDSGWYARIETDGSLTLNEKTLRPVGLEEELRKFAADPAGYAASYGRESSNCCFCGTAITSNESLSVGYGPICAERWGLPWGVQPLEVQDENIESELAYFSGSTEIYRHGFFKMLYTQGVQHLAERAQCYWLLDAIASWQIKPKIKREPFQVWTITVNQKKEAVLTCVRDTGAKPLATQRIEYTDFPLPEMKFYLCDGTLMLPSEY
ncbi:MAG TPA: DUF6011 domain-containing protein [Cyanophyceae cyanobacterium]